jgi:hypothetical protein
MECRSCGETKSIGNRELVKEEIVGYKLCVVDGKIVKQEEIPALPLSLKINI